VSRISGRTLVFSMDMSKVLIWNVRGLNHRARRDAVHDMVASTHPDLACLQEMKKAAISC
jgi:exonuclease III